VPINGITQQNTMMVIELDFIPWNCIARRIKMLHGSGCSMKKRKN
jgi:hypothetical protein